MLLWNTIVHLHFIIVKNIYKYKIVFKHLLIINNIPIFTVVVINCNYYYNFLSNCSLIIKHNRHYMEYLHLKLNVTAELFKKKIITEGKRSIK